MNFSLKLWKPALTVIGLCFISAQAFTEDQWNYLQVSCNKEMDYFRLQNMHFWRNEIKMRDCNEKGCKESLEALNKHFESQYNMYTPESLRNIPYTCELPRGMVTAEIANYSTSPDRSLASYDLVIKRNGEELNRFFVLGTGDQSTHLVELDLAHLQLRDCTLPTNDFGNGNSSCKKLPAPKNMEMEK